MKAEKLTNVGIAFLLSQLKNPIKPIQLDLALRLSENTADLEPSQQVLIALGAVTATAAFQLSADYLTVRRTGQLNNPIAQTYLSANPDQFMMATLIGVGATWSSLITNPANHAILFNLAHSGQPDALVSHVTAQRLCDLAYCLGTNILINAGIAEKVAHGIHTLLDHTKALARRISFDDTYAQVRDAVNSREFINYAAAQEMYFNPRRNPPLSSRGPNFF